MSDTKTDVSNPEVLVREKLDELISFRKENDSKTDFWAKQFDLGLAWVHFPEGAGGLNVNPKFQLLVNETLRKEGISINNRIANLLGIGMGAPTIVEYGTKDQIDKLDDLYHNVLVPKVRHNQSLWINCDRAKLFDSLTRRFEWN